ncbi:GGDEF domain-containing protein [Vibrio campbellii]|uniref:GGDEF domain-containing protein n=1 Tax=Vibrio campbellii TaxID=680 RepID=UPI001E51230A|nr:GGDEF domain-containing protein [Vibrio campbellii]
MIAKRIDELVGTCFQIKQKAVQTNRMLLLKLSKRSLSIAIAVYLAVASLMSIVAMHQSKRDFDAIANYFELYKSSAILAGLLIESKLDEPRTEIPKDELEASQRIQSLDAKTLTTDELIAYKVLGDLLQYNHKLTERQNISVYYRSYTGKKLVFAKPNEDYKISEQMFDPLLCSPARTCSLNMHDTELADRVVISDSYLGNLGTDTFTVTSPVYKEGTIVGDVVVDIRVNYQNLNGRTVETNLVNGFYYVTVGFENYPFSNLAGALILPIDNDSAIIYQLPIIKVLIDNLWVLFVTWAIVGTFHRLYASNVQHRSHLAHAIKNASIDELTSLYNRKVFEDSDFENAIKEGHYAVILIDGKKFKQINDTHGHKAGDLALIHIARTMKSTFRQSDWLIRLGGDEFVVVMPLCPLESAERLATNLRENIVARPLVRYGISVQVTTGVAKATSEETLMDVIERADQDMYQYKDA